MRLAFCLFEPGQNYRRVNLHSHILILEEVLLAAYPAQRERVMISKYVPASNGVMTFDDIQVAFGLSGRAWDEVNHKLVVIQFHGRPILYGEWEPTYLPNGNDFNAVVLAFGYRDGYSAGSPDLSDRQVFSKNEQEIIEKLIRRLFASSATERAGSPFSSPGSRFMGEVLFLPGWVRN